MPAVDTEGQFKFLLSCIKHSVAGKVNFDSVAQELGIVSKAAAAKRYERLLKAHDIAVTTPRKGGTSKTSGEDPETPTTKKRKRGAAAPKQDSDEESTPIKKERVKKERAVKKEESDEDSKVKGEEEDDYISE